MKTLKLICILLMIQFSVQAQKEQANMRDLLADYEFSTYYIKVGTVQTAYIKEGQGEKTLVFVHGLSSNLDAWSKNIKSLRQNYTCIALDLPGFGKSDKPEVSYTPTYYADFLHQFIKQLNLGTVTVLGHSMGGQASMKWAIKYPADVDQLILVAPAGLEQFSPTASQTLQTLFTVASVESTTDEQIEKNYALNFFDPPAQVGKMIQDRKNIKSATDFQAHCAAIVSSVQGMLNQPVFEELAQISQPTLVIYGTKDQLIPNRYFNPQLTTGQVGAIALRKIQNAHLEMLEEAGHFVQFEKPERVNRLIEEFLQKQ